MPLTEGLTDPKLDSRERASRLNERPLFAYRLLGWLDDRVPCWGGMPVVHIDVAVAHPTHTRPIMPRGILEQWIAIMALGCGVAHRDIGVPGAAAIPRLFVNRRSRCRTVLDWP